MQYHISWLESAIYNLRNSNHINSVNGDMTIQEFLEMYVFDELSKAIKVD